MHAHRKRESEFSLYLCSQSGKAGAYSPNCAKPRQTTLTPPPSPPQPKLWHSHLLNINLCLYITMATYSWFVVCTYDKKEEEEKNFNKLHGEKKGLKFIIAINKKYTLVFKLHQTVYSVHPAPLLHIPALPCHFWFAPGLCPGASSFYHLPPSPWWYFTINSTFISSAARWTPSSTFPANQTSYSHPPPSTTLYL